MGFQYRKTVRLGPLRLNLSKGGVGWSLGGRAVRRTHTADGKAYTTFNLPGGLTYRTKRQPKK